MATLEELEDLVDKLNIELVARTAVLELLVGRYVLDPMEAKQPGTIAKQLPEIEDGLRARDDLSPPIREAMIATWQRLFARVTPKRPWHAPTLSEAVAASVFELKEWWQRRR